MDYLPQWMMANTQRTVKARSKERSKHTLRNCQRTVKAHTKDCLSTIEPGSDFQIKETVLP